MSLDQFPERLKSMRQRRRLTAKEMAKRAGMNESQLSHFERGQRLPSCENLCRLADALEVSTDYLLGRTDTWWPSGPAEEELSAQYVNLSTHSRTLVKRIVQVFTEEEPYVD